MSSPPDDSSASYRKLLADLGVTTDQELIEALRSRTGKTYNQHAIDGWKRSEPGRGVPKKVWLDLERAGSDWSQSGKSYLGHGFFLNLEELAGLLENLPEAVQLKILELVEKMNTGPPNSPAETVTSKRKGRP